MKGGGGVKGGGREKGGGKEGGVKGGGGGTRVGKDTHHTTLAPIRVQSS